MEEGFSFKKLWDDIVHFFSTQYWNIIIFFLVLIVGIIVIKTILTIIKKTMRRSKMEKVAQSFIVNVLRYVLYLVLLLILLSLIGVEIGGIVTALSAVVLAIGMALKDYITNLVSGIIIVSQKMIRKGDYISVDGTDGIVDDITFLFTSVNTIDNKKVYIPNSKITSHSLYNYGMNGSRRVDFTFSVAYDSDVEQVKKIVVDVILSCDKAATDPAPFCRLKTLGQSSIDFFANCWCNSADYWTVYYYVTETVFNEFKKKGVSIPYPQSEVRLRTDEVNYPVIKGTPKRTEPEFKIKPREDDIDEFGFIKRVTKDVKNKKKSNAKKKTTAQKKKEK